MKKLLIALLLCSVLPLASNAQDLARMCIEPPESTVKVGERFTVSLMIYDVKDMGGFWAELLYVPSIVTVESVVLGDFIVDNYDWYLPVGFTIDNEIGIAKFGALSNLDEPPGPSGSGELAIITLVARGEGQSLLSLHKTGVSGIAEDIDLVLPCLVENGRVTVEPYRVYLPLVSR